VPETAITDSRGPDDPIYYGRRRGRRLNPGRRARLAEALPLHRIALPDGGALDLTALFPRPMRAYWLEIGFGNGEHLAAQAATHRDIGCIGCEPYVNGVSMALRHIAEAELDNFKIFADDARKLLPVLPEASLDRVFLLFPDPWPKTRHHRRRFLQPAVIDDLACAMKAGALLRLATDHRELGRFMLGQVLRHPAFEWLAEKASDWRETPADHKASRYQTKSVDRGVGCVYMDFRRRFGRCEKTP
jgi:tRNA (guanine-N7-)-methyltransferase